MESIAGPGASEHEFFNALLEQASDLIAVIDAAGVFRYASPSFLRVLGYQPEDLVGTNAFAHVHPDDAPASRAAFVGVLAAPGDALATRFRYRHALGAWRLFEITGTNRIDDALVRGVVLNARDVTERAEAEMVRAALLAREHEALAALMEMAGALVALDDSMEGGPGQVAGGDAVAQRLVALIARVIGCKRVTITAANSATGARRPVAWMGLSTDEERAWRSGEPGTGLRDFLTDDELQRLFADGLITVSGDDPPERALPYNVRTMLLVVLRTGASVAGVLAMDHGGATYHYSEQEIGLARAAATLAGLVLERDRLLREHAEAQAQEIALREANRRMDAFLAMASHELKTPLTSVGGNIQIVEYRLRRTKPGDGMEAAALLPLLERARRGTGRMSRLVNDLLDMSRIQSDHLTLRCESIELGVVVREVVEEQRGNEPTRVLNLDLPVSPVLVFGDAVRLGQVVSNFLTNAQHYTPKDREIDISMRVEAAGARVSVRDYGPGIAAADLPMVWERGIRIEGSGHRAGLGLGLYISRTLVERHGGKVGAESVLGGGSTFWFIVPLAPEAVSRA